MLSNLNLWSFSTAAGSLLAETQTSFYMLLLVMSALDRLQKLEQLYLCGVPYDFSFSLETLLDSLICLYDECCSSTLRRERAIAEFVEFSRYL